MNDPLSSSPPPPQGKSADGARLAGTDAEEPRTWAERIWRFLHNLLRPPADVEDLREVVEELIEEPLSESGLSQEEHVLLSHLAKIRERKVSDCMIQRTDIVAAGEDATLSDLVDLMAAHGHSRIPIYRDTLDDVAGMVHIKDILPCIAYEQTRSLQDLMRPVLFVAPSMGAAKLLLQMRQTRHHVAMVVDEFGGIDGMVTIGDLVEQVVGEIEDEHDAPPAPMLVRRSDNTLLIDARMPIEDFRQQTGQALPLHADDDIDTLGGYVAHLAGRVPQIGEKIVAHHVMFEVLEMDQGRIRRLRMRPHTPASTEQKELSVKATSADLAAPTRMRAG